MDTLASFVFARMPELHFGAGKLAQLPTLVRQRGSKILLVTGAASFVRSTHYTNLLDALTQAGIQVAHAAVKGEPSPALVDETAARYRTEGIDWVVAIGGGSVLDAGKAISAMIPQQGSVHAYLEGMETAKHDGRKVPLIAIPTSSGTGSEATKNAVLSEIGRDGFKSSLRHDNFVPEIALIDPELMLSCPPTVTAACGLDALTQLLEAYVSAKSSPMTDVLAYSGLEHVAAGFIASVERGASDVAARGHMAYAAFLSGVALANAGLGVVHGFAGPIGGFFPAPHGEVCGTLIGEATRINIDALLRDPDKNRETLAKFAKVGVLLSGKPSTTIEYDCRLLVDTLTGWIEQTGIPRLQSYGITRADFAKILDKSNNKNSPVQLNREQMASILEARL